MIGYQFFLQSSFRANSKCTSCMWRYYLMMLNIKTTGTGAYMLSAHNKTRTQYMNLYLFAYPLSTSKTRRKMLLLSRSLALLLCVRNLTCIRWQNLVFVYLSAQMFRLCDRSVEERFVRVNLCQDRDLECTSATVQCLRVKLSWYWSFLATQ